MEVFCNVLARLNRQLFKSCYIENSRKQPPHLDNKYNRGGSNKNLFITDLKAVSAEVKAESVSNSHCLIRFVLYRNPPRQFQTQNERLIIHLIVQNSENLYCKPPLRTNAKYYGLGATFHSPFNIHTEYHMLILHLKQDIQPCCSKCRFSQQTVQRHNLHVNKQQLLLLCL